ncbi:tetratricopeptide repeat protein [Streptosporangium sp. NPDC020145]|uniref:tetratricopeptide repeat protein n=1 Tax=Streptosporangium sp. NPDC020145 TaxID=3154694 RepID=UPI003418A937
MPAHLRIVGDRRTDRLRRATEEPDGGRAVVAVCHQRLRGPYTGVDTLLRAVLPEAYARWPELVDRHRVELLYGVPELAELVGEAPQQLAFKGPFEERTRFYGSQMIRCMNQGIVTFLNEHARRLAEAGDPAPLLVFEDAHAAEPSTQELIALLLRRSDPGRLRVVVSTVPVASLTGELEGALARHTETVQAVPGEPSPDGRSVEELVRAYVMADGISDDPAEIAAYEAADPEFVRRLHDLRAEELTPDADLGTRMGALPYHRERGADPGGLGREALTEGLRISAEIGFSAMTLDMGLRGRAVTDPVANADDFRRFTALAANALVPLHRLDESFDLYMDLRRRYTDPNAHMISSYGIAMLYTRFFSPRDHETALAWQNNAVAIAALLPDARERTLRQVFNDNALALIEMHRGNLEHGLELIRVGIERLDAMLEPDEWVVHRSQLLYNRTRLLAALGRTDEAYADFTVLIEMDPYYTDYLCERAKISRRRGDLDAALADYDRAVAMAPPFPELFYNRGTARAEVGDADGALADFGYVLEMEPDDVATRMRRAELLLGLGDFEAAEADVVAGLELRPADPELLCMRGTIALEYGDAEQAARWLDAALDGDPGYAAALVNRAVASFELGRPASSVEDLTRVLDLLGPDPDVLLNRGLAHEAAGSADLALRDVETALGLPGADVAELEPVRKRCRRRLAGV